MDRDKAIDDSVYEQILFVPSDGNTFQELMRLDSEGTICINAKLLGLSDGPDAVVRMTRKGLQRAVFLGHFDLLDAMPEGGKRVDRKQACDEYSDQYEDDEWDEDLHIIVGDYNFEDRCIFGAISSLSLKLQKDRENEDLRRRFDFLVELLTLPMPDGWDDEDAI